jgi:hypothetical protein
MRPVAALLAGDLLARSTETHDVRQPASASACAVAPQWPTSARRAGDCQP